MLEVDIVLPWPPAALSANARQHPFALARAKKRFRQLCWGVTLEQGAHLRAADLLLGNGPIGVDLEFRIPTEYASQKRRGYDRDNLVARMKSGLDGVADALDVDDVRFHLGAPIVGEPVEGGQVRVRLRGEKPAPPASEGA